MATQKKNELLKQTYLDSLEKDKSTTRIGINGQPVNANMSV
jgi:hypothetical protein